MSGRLGGWPAVKRTTSAADWPSSWSARELNVRQTDYLGGWPAVELVGSAADQPSDRWAQRL